MMIKYWMKLGLVGGLIFVLIGFYTALPENIIYSKPIYIILNLGAYIANCSTSAGINLIPCSIISTEIVNFIFGFMIANIIYEIKRRFI